MTKPKKPIAHNPFAEGPAPGLGGAWIRQKDGTLMRDDDTEQAIPEEEPASSEQPSGETVPPPLASDAPVDAPAKDR